MPAAVPAGRLPLQQWLLFPSFFLLSTLSLPNDDFTGNGRPHEGPKSNSLAHSSYFAMDEMSWIALQQQKQAIDPTDADVRDEFRRLIEKIGRLDDGELAIQPVNAFFERFFAGRDSLEQWEWERALPSELERGEMRELVIFLYRLANFDSVSADQSFLAKFVPRLANSISLTFIGPNVTKNGTHLLSAMFCIVHERLPSLPFKTFARNWGYLVLRSRAHCARPQLHHSAPHFQSDGNVCNQSAALFEKTGSRSLAIAGASRFSVIGNLSTSCQPRNALADAAHNNETIFHTMCIALLDATKLEGELNATFMQWHGMAETSCRKSSAFLSAGAGKTSPIYGNGSAPVNKLAAAVNKLAGTRVASTPAQDGQCKLVAGTNVFGRIVNGVPAGQCCRTGAKPDAVKGHFIHIEQKRAMRDNWELWTAAIESTFPANNAVEKYRKVGNWGVLSLLSLYFPLIIVFIPFLMLFCC